MEYLYCKVYLDGERDAHAVKALVADVSNGTIEAGTVHALGLEVDVFRNRPTEASPAPDDFVQWPVYLEIEAAAERAMTLDGFITSIALLLTRLQAKGLRSVASCDFEDQLKASMS